MSVSPISPEEASRFASLRQKEKELNDNILTIEKDKKAIQEEGEKRAQKIEDYYLDLTNQEQSRGAHALSTQRAQNYEQLKRLKQTQNHQKKQSEASFELDQANLEQQKQLMLEKKKEEIEAQLKEIQNHSEKKISTYKAQQQDDFYRVRTFNAKLTETSDEFILTAKVPKYEQKHITGTIRGNQIVLSGYRQHEETHEKTPGHQQSTHSYQTFSESFPLTAPVDPKGLSRHFEDDQVTLRVPKLKGYEYENQNKKVIDKLQSKKPDLPNDLFISTYQDNLE